MGLLNLQRERRSGYTESLRESAHTSTQRSLQWPAQAAPRSCPITPRCTSFVEKQMSSSFSPSLQQQPQKRVVRFARVVARGSTRATCVNVKSKASHALLAKVR